MSIAFVFSMLYNFARKRVIFMIRCNLAVLLAERSVKIVRMAADTELSRTTLTALATNKSTGIQYDTLEKICRYLNVTPSDLFVMYPIDFNVSVEFDRVDHRALLIFDVAKPPEPTVKYHLLAEIDYYFGSTDDSVTGFSMKIGAIDDTIENWLYTDEQKDEAAYNKIKEIISALPPQFTTQLLNQIEAAVVGAMKGHVKLADEKLDTDISFQWSSS